MESIGSKLKTGPLFRSLNDETLLEFANNGSHEAVEALTDRASSPGRENVLDGLMVADRPIFEPGVTEEGEQFLESMSIDTAAQAVAALESLEDVRSRAEGLKDFAERVNELIEGLESQCYEWLRIIAGVLEESDLTDESQSNQSLSLVYEVKVSILMVRLSELHVEIVNQFAKKDYDFGELVDKADRILRLLNDLVGCDVSELFPQSEERVSDSSGVPMRKEIVEELCLLNLYRAIDNEDDPLRVAKSLISFKSVVLGNSLF